MLRHSVRHYSSRPDRCNPVKRILRKALNQINPTNTPNECVVEQIRLPQNPRNHKSDLSAHSQILLSQLLLCCDTQFGTIEACPAALTVSNPFYANRKQVKPRNTPNGCVVQEIWLPQIHTSKKKSKSPEKIIKLRKKSKS